MISDKIKKEASPYLRVAGIKMFHGNSLSGKTCWLSEPYDLINPITNKKDYYGYKHKMIMITCFIFI